jgi:hypothetical protein
LFAAVHESINKSKRKKIAIGIKTHTIPHIPPPSLDFFPLALHLRTLDLDQQSGLPAADRSRGVS